MMVYIYIYIYIYIYVYIYIYIYITRSQQNKLINEWAAARLLCKTSITLLPSGSEQHEVLQFGSI